MARLRARLGEKRLQALFDEGRALSPETALCEAEASLSGDREEVAQ
jgi:hypothetical protein